MTQYYRYFPAIHELKMHRGYLDYRDQGYREDLLTQMLQEAVNHCKSQTSSLEKAIRLLTKEEDLAPLITEKIFTVFRQLIQKVQDSGPIKVINGTGIVLHTNLGRARLHSKTMAAVEAAAVHYSNLEYDIDTGERGSRHDHVEELLKLLTGSEAAMVVNNNAAAVYLILSALAKKSEVIVSRGELVEIGGSFRISSIMNESGAVLSEVGTTNKTHLKDYEAALTNETAMIMKVHQSNFKMIGFTESVTRDALVPLAQKNHCLYYEDLGSGALFDYQQSGIGDEPILTDIIASGADLVSCSGDKLFGGPQAGIILGKKKWIDVLKKHQLARVLRIDKLTLAALSETLKAYLKESSDTISEIPTLRDLTDTKDFIYKKAKRLIKETVVINPRITLEIVPVESKVGGGTMPEVLLPSYAVQVITPDLKAQQIAEKLRNGTLIMVGRIHKEAFLLDCRTISEDEISTAAAQLALI